METTTLFARSISCDHCRETVERAVSALPGVEEVQIIVSATQITVRFDPAQLGTSHIESALAEAGYPTQTGEAAPATVRGKRQLGIGIPQQRA